MRILAIDPGQKHIGLAISDESATLARPLGIIKHTSRLIDAASVAARAVEQGAGLILVGQSFDLDGNPNLAGRRAANFAETLRQQTAIPVLLWDEALTTRDARELSLELGLGRKKRRGHLDDTAAALLLQSYLDNLPRSE